jgi:DNA (cytosine-5)-methyltransferase 1
MTMVLYLRNRRKSKEKLTVIELFSGVGSQILALNRLGINCKLIGVSEVNSKAVIAHKALNGDCKNFGDITKISSLPYADLWTYSFPCQDLSTNGKQQGIIRGKTRSGLLYEVKRLLDVAQQKGSLPKYLLMENVKNLIGKKFKKDFDSWCDYLEKLGYNNYLNVLDASDIGIPQHRERVFVVSIRKNIDNGKFQMPDFKSRNNPKPILKDFLESEVDKKFYISEDRLKRFELDQTALDMGKNVVGRIFGKNGKCYGCTGKVFGENSIIGTWCRGNCSTSARTVFEGYDDNGEFKVRYITPLEVMRLMGFKDDEYCKLCDAGLSGNDIYRLMGNSIVVNVLEEIFKELFSDYMVDSVGIGVTMSCIIEGVSIHGTVAVSPTNDFYIYECDVVIVTFFILLSHCSTLYPP